MPIVTEKNQKYVETDFSIAQLTEEELKEIRSYYFYSIEDVKPLNKSQQWVLDNKSFLSPNCCQQVLFKLKGIIDIKIIKDNLVKMAKNNPILRTSFFINNERSLQVILPERAPEIIFLDYIKMKVDNIDYFLDELLLVGQRRGFDLKKDRLLRVRVIRFAADTYAMLIVFPQLIEDNWDMKNIFNGIFQDQEGLDLVAQMPSSRQYSFTQYLENRSKEDIIKTFAYWKKILFDAKAPELPMSQNDLGLYERDSFVTELDENLTNLTTEFANTNGRLIALFETAWGLMLQKYSKENDATFGIVLSNHNDDIDNADFSNVINILPVRLRENQEDRIGYAFKRQQVHLFIAKSYSGCSQKELELLWPNCKNLFNHVLNFYDFYNSKRFTEVDFQLGVKIVAINSYDDNENDLIVYFRKVDEIIQIEFVYNKIVFSKNNIENLLINFLGVLTQMVTKPNAKISELKLIEEPEDIIDTVEENRIFNLGLAELRKKELFGNLTDKEWQTLTKNIMVKKYIKGDIILAEGELQDNIYLIYEGLVEVIRSSNDGWNRKLGDLSFGNIISYNNLFEAKESSISAKVISKKANIIIIKNEYINAVLASNFDFLKDVIKAITAQAELFQNLWLKNIE